MGLGRILSTAAAALSIASAAHAQTTITTRLGVAHLELTKQLDLRSHGYGMQSAAIAADGLLFSIDATHEREGFILRGEFEGRVYRTTKPIPTSRGLRVLTKPYVEALVQAYSPEIIAGVRVVAGASLGARIDPDFFVQDDGTYGFDSPQSFLQQGMIGLSTDPTRPLVFFGSYNLGTIYDERMHGSETRPQAIQGTLRYENLFPGKTDADSARFGLEFSVLYRAGGTMERPQQQLGYGGTFIFTPRADWVTLELSYMVLDGTTTPGAGNGQPLGPKQRIMAATLRKDFTFKKRKRGR